MQGIIYTGLADFVIEALGIAAWEQALEMAKPASGGGYTSGGRYADEELTALVTALSEMTGKPAPELIEAYGEYLFARLYQNLPEEAESLKTLKEFLLGIDSVIHREVKRLYPSAYLPSFEYDDTNNDKLHMLYSSKRKLCFAAVGLIRGAAKQFGERVSIEHPECMHQGAERCRLVVTWER